ncbi:MAG TPA: RsmG family class I SAM-dependent methyltransferase, partial [Rhodothermales bacterium]|nr:RsmG family class I SAM-dependent methyltransferase [Rhodothermales bacterium]
MKEIIDHPFYIRLSRVQQDQLVTYQKQLLHLNQRINLISRDTEPFFAERHVLHSLALTDRGFPPGCTIVDWGTGGGLPAIPLAIVFPEV